ncbi:MAG TPA: extracellular solute-binding protein, partial [Ilumatobacteraceae bacterium]|nr:extracellular solute-binding protein [Ilumatobacteraceae bacterium]
DVLWQPDDVFAKAATDKGWLAQLDPARIPGLDQVPADDRTDTYAAVLTQPWGIAYNTDLVKGDQIPTTWTDLADGPAIDGGLLVANPANSVSTSAVYNFWLDQFGEEFFTKLRDTQRFNIGDSVSNAIQQVGA